MNTEFFGYTRDEWEKVFRILNELHAVHPDMDPKFWESDALELALIVENKQMRDGLNEYL